MLKYALHILKTEVQITTRHFTLLNLDMRDFNGNLPYALVRAVGLKKNSDNGDARNSEMPDDSMDGIQIH